MTIHITVYFTKKNKHFQPLQKQQVKCLEKCSQIQNSGSDKADISLHSKFLVYCGLCKILRPYACSRDL